MMPKQLECTVTSPYYYKEIPAMGYETVTMEVNCPRIKKLEHVSSRCQIQFIFYLVEISDSKYSKFYHGTQLPMMRMMPPDWIIQKDRVISHF